MRRRCLLAGLCCLTLAGCDSAQTEAERHEAIQSAKDKNAAPVAAPVAIGDAKERGLWTRVAATQSELSISKTGWAFTSAATEGKPVARPKLPAPNTHDALDFRGHAQVIKSLRIGPELAAAVTLKTYAAIEAGEFLFALELLAHAGAREVHWRPENAGQGLELRLTLPRYDWSAEQHKSGEDPTELVLALRGGEVIAGLRPLAYFAQHRIAGDIAALANRSAQFRTPVAQVGEQLPTNEWLTRLCGESRDQKVHLSLSTDSSVAPTSLWALAGELNSVPGCELAPLIDNALPARPEGARPNINSFEDARKIVDLTRPGRPQVRLHRDRFRNAALRSADTEAVLAREPELLMTITDRKGRLNSSIQRAVWLAGQGINDCYREQRKLTPLWAPRAVASGQLAAEGRAAYVAVHGLEAAPEFSACVKALLEKRSVNEMERLLGFRADMDFYPFGGVVHPAKLPKEAVAEEQGSAAPTPIPEAQAKAAPSAATPPRAATPAADPPSAQAPPADAPPAAAAPPAAGDGATPPPTAIEP